LLATNSGTFWTISWFAEGSAIRYAFITVSIFRVNVNGTVCRETVTAGSIVEGGQPHKRNEENQHLHHRQWFPNALRSMGLATRICQAEKWNGPRKGEKVNAHHSKPTDDYWEVLWWTLPVLRLNLDLYRLRLTLYNMTPHASEEKRPFHTPRV
jgi:hypothetical protein